MTAFSSGWSTDGGIQPLKRGLSPVRIQRDSLPSSTKDSLREHGRGVCSLTSGLAQAASADGQRSMEAGEEDV